MGVGERHRLARLTMRDDVNPALQGLVQRDEMTARLVRENNRVARRRFSNNGVYSVCPSSDNGTPPACLKRSSQDRRTNAGVKHAKLSKPSADIVAGEKAIFSGENERGRQNGALVAKNGAGPTIKPVHGLDVGARMRPPPAKQGVAVGG